MNFNEIDGKKLKDLVDKAQNGDGDAMYKILEMFFPLINSRSRGDEDCRSYIITKLIYRIQNFKEKNEKNEKI